MNPIVGKDEFPRILNFKIPGHIGDKKFLARSFGLPKYVYDTRICVIAINIYKRVGVILILKRKGAR